MQEDFAQQAIQAAIGGEWQKAARLNRQILKINPQDTEALLRLANANTQLGKIKEATKIYESVLKVDPHNNFAQKSITKIKKIKPSQKIAAQHSLNSSFLEEPGKTKTAMLVHPAYTQVTARLDAGERVLLTPRRRRISLTTETGLYIGRLPDDLSFKLLGLIRRGNKYEAVVKSVNGNQVKIFIREIYRSAKLETTPSFPTDVSSIPSTEE